MKIEYCVILNIQLCLTFYYTYFIVLFLNIRIIKISLSFYSAYGFVFRVQVKYLSLIVDLASNNDPELKYGDVYFFVSACT